MTEEQFTLWIKIVNNHMSALHEQQEQILNELITLREIFEKVFSSAAPTVSLSEIKPVELTSDQELISEESILTEMEKLRKSADFNHLSECDLRTSAIRNLSKTDKYKEDDIPF